ARYDFSLFLNRSASGQKCMPDIWPLLSLYLQVVLFVKKKADEQFMICMCSLAETHLQCTESLQSVLHGLMDQALIFRLKPGVLEQTSSATRFLFFV
ncbi:hypothetical protein XENOCAPTIV_009487, partial [Xenoophorus captivus]